MVADIRWAESPRDRWGALRQKFRRHRQRDGAGGRQAIADTDGFGPNGVVLDHEPNPIDATKARCAGLLLPSPQPGHMALR